MADEARSPQQFDLAAALDAVRQTGDTGLSLDAVAERIADRVERLDATTVEAELRDRIYIELANAAMDVERLAEAIDDDRSPAALRRAIDGDTRLTLGEYDAIRRAVREGG